MRNGFLFVLAVSAEMLMSAGMVRAQNTVPLPPVKPRIPAEPSISSGVVIPTKTRTKDVAVYEKSTCRLKTPQGEVSVACLKEIPMKELLPEGTELTVRYDLLIPPGYIEREGAPRFESMPSIGGVTITGYSPPPAAPGAVTPSGPSAETIRRINERKPYISVVSIESGEIVRRLDPRPLPAGKEKIDYVFRWDAHNPQGTWARAIYDRLDQLPTRIVSEQAPSDIHDFCPKYDRLTTHERKIFWIGLFNEIAYRESLFVPLVMNDEGFFSDKNAGVTSRGILQTSFQSLQSKRYKEHGCSVSTPDEVHDSVKNLQCGLAIFSYLIGRDGCISCFINGKVSGPALYWSTLRPTYDLACERCEGASVKLGKRGNIIKSLSNRIPMCFDGPIQ